VVAGKGSKTREENTSKENDKKIRKGYEFQQLLEKSNKEYGILDSRRAIQL